jgi:hypothetical protein
MGVVGAIDSEQAGIDRCEYSQPPKVRSDTVPFSLRVIVEELRRRRALLSPHRLGLPPVEALMTRVTPQIFKYVGIGGGPGMIASVQDQVGSVVILRLSIIDSPENCPIPRALT